MNELLKPTFDWIRDDWQSNKPRFIVELLAWAISIGCSITMAVTVPSPPLLALYPVWITGCAMYAWAAYTRKSFGMLANYILLTAIDTFAVRVECKVGVQEELAAKFNLSAYPNPFGSSTNVHFETMQSENVKISVIDMLGRVVKSSDLGKIVGGAHDLNLDESFFGSAGSYLVKVEIGDVSIYKPLIKQ
jgi:hypothetical protein